jgi:hypothetical protein
MLSRVRRNRLSIWAWFLGLIVKRSTSSTDSASIGLAKMTRKTRHTCPFVRPAHSILRGTRML